MIKNPCPECGTAELTHGRPICQACAVLQTVRRAFICLICRYTGAPVVCAEGRHYPACPNCGHCRNCP